MTKPTKLTKPPRPLANMGFGGPDLPPTSADKTPTAPTKPPGRTAACRNNGATTGQRAGQVAHG